MTKTIRKNAVKKITDLLRSAVLIRQDYISDDSRDSDRNGRCSMGLVLNNLDDMDRIYLEELEEIACFRIHRNHGFTAYLTPSAVRRSMTEQGFEKFFPGSILMRIHEEVSELEAAARFAGQSKVTVFDRDNYRFQIEGSLQWHWLVRVSSHSLKNQTKDARFHLCWEVLRDAPAQCEVESGSHQ